MPANFRNLGGTLCCLCLVLAPPAIAQPGTFTVLPADIVPYSINDSGAVAGIWTSNLGFLRAPDGTIVTFKAADDAVYTIPLCINNSGIVTGYYEGGDGAAHGFVRGADSVITTFDAPDAGRVITPSGINAAGVVTGAYLDPLQNYHGFVRAVDGTLTPINAPDAKQTLASAINTRGEIAGYSGSPFGPGFVRTAKAKFKIFDGPAGTQLLTADAINDAGDVTGYYTIQPGRPHGYIRHRDGALTTFDVGNGTDTEPKAINAGGMVAGYGAFNPRGRHEGFIRYPNGDVQTIHGPHARSTYVLGMNKDNAVVGTFFVHSDPPPGTSYGFIWTP